MNILKESNNKKNFSEKNYNFLSINSNKKDSPSLDCLKYIFDSDS
jgi:hypothetical protein